MSGSARMDKSYVYRFRVEGELTDRWSDWFEGLVIRRDSPGETTLTGRVVDQAQLLGYLNRLHGLNLALISVNRETGSEQNKSPG